MAHTLNMQEWVAGTSYISELRGIAKQNQADWNFNRREMQQRCPPFGIYLRLASDVMTQRRLENAARCLPLHQPRCFSAPGWWWRGPGL